MNEISRTHGAGTGRLEDKAFFAKVDGVLPVAFKFYGERIFDIELMMQAEMTLLLANTLHSMGDYRNSFAYTARAARELFTAIGTRSDSQEPLKHLFSALQDLDRGVPNKALEPAPISNRPGDPAAEWEARACLAGAVEFRMALNEKEREAAEYVRKKIEIIRGQDPCNREQPINRLIDWRKSFRSKKPPAGQPIFEAATILINQAKALDAAGRIEHLHRCSDGFISMARTHRARLEPTG